MKAEDYLKSKGWSRENSVLGSALFNGIVEMLDDFARIKTAQAMPTITDEEIEAHFTTPHYHYEKGHYYKVRKDRIFGAKWMRDEIRKRMVEVRPIFENHGTQINDTDDEHPTNKEKFDGNYLPDTDENR